MFFIIALISVFKVKIIFIQIKFILEGDNQYSKGVELKQIKGVIQLRDIYKDVEGSKIEKRLFIIKN